MKLYEIVVILLFVIAIILQFFNIGEDTALIILLSANTLLALSYFIGGYWLFKNKEKTNTTISILAGITFGVALICFWTRIIVTPNEIIFYLPTANIVFFIVLSVLFFIKKNNSDFIKPNKPILIRSFIILIFTCFFFYIPIEFEPYNDLIRSMNASSERAQHNLNMAKYHEKAQIELDSENYEKAVEYSLLSEIEGRRGFKLSDNDLFLDNGEVDTAFLKELDLKKMSGIYERLYVVYTRLAHHQLENEKAEEALKNYKIAHQILYIYNLNDGKWQQQNIVSFANIGTAFSSVNQLEQATQSFNQAISLIDSLDNTDSKKIIYAYNEIANYLSKTGLYKESNDYHLSSIEVQLKDSLKTETRENLAESYMKMGKNYSKLADYDKSLKNYEQVFFYQNDKTNDIYLQSFIYTGLVHLQLRNYEKAESIFVECLKLYGNKGKEGLTNVGVSKIFLARTYIELNKYKEAEKLLQEGLEITRVEEGKTSSNYIVALSVYSNLNFILSNYQDAEKQYQEVFELSKNESENSYRTLQLLIQLGITKINLSKINQAEQYANQANEKILKAEGNPSESSDNLGNELAYLNYLISNYSFSREMYELVIKVDKKRNVTKDLTTGVALNGLGLLEMEEKKYVKADSLFHRSLEIHKAIFKTSNPSLATLHLNMAKLYILKKEYQKVEKNLAISLKMNQDLFPSTHTNFADIYVAYGDLAKQQNNKNEANQNYQKALKIYAAKFDEGHFKIEFVKEKIKSVQF